MQFDFTTELLRDCDETISQFVDLCDFHNISLSVRESRNKFFVPPSGKGGWEGGGGGRSQAEDPGGRGRLHAQQEGQVRVEVGWRWGRQQVRFISHCCPLNWTEWNAYILKPGSFGTKGTICEKVGKGNMSAQFQWISFSHKYQSMPRAGPYRY